MLQEGELLTGANGQLGHGTKHNEILSCKIKELMGSKVTQLPQEGELLTGTYGQLGHGTKHNEILSHKIMELMGSKVTKLASGR